MPTNIISQILNYRHMLTANGSIDDSDVNAIITASFIYLNLTGIKQNPHYFPDVETRMIIDTMGSLSPDNALLAYLVSLLIELIDNIKQKDMSLKQDELQKITKILCNLPSNAFELIDKTQNSPALTQLLALGVSVDKIIPKQQLNLEELDFIIDAKVSELIDQAPKWRDTEYLKESAKNIKEVTHKLMSGNAEIDKEDLEKIFHPYTYGIISTEILKDLTQLIATRCQNKELFITNYLSEYKDLYDAAFPKSSLKNFLLYRMSDILAELGELVSKDKFLHLVESFELENPWSMENDAAYADYFVTYCLIQGKEIHDSYDNQQALIEKIATPEKLLKVLKLCKSSEILLSSNPKLHDIPATLQQFLEEKNLMAPFEHFLTYITRINNKAGSHQQRNISLFFIKYELQIIQLIELMGEFALNNMQLLVANTILPLEKMLEICPILDKSLIEPLHEYCDSQVKTTTTFETFKLCLIAIGAITKIKEEDWSDRSSLGELIMGMGNNKFTQAFLTTMIKYILAKILPSIQLELSEATIETLLKRFPAEKLVNLVAASQKMEHDPYKEIYLELLKIDFFGGQPDTFLHDTKQNSKLGQDIARHNQKIQARLMAHGIDPVKALHYSKTYDFILLPSSVSVEQLSIDNSYLVLWRYLNLLDDEIKKIDISQLNNKTEKKITKIKDNIGQVASKINKQLNRGIGETIAAKNVLADQNILNSIIGRNIVANCNELEQNQLKLPNSFFEFSRHVNDQFNLLTKPTSIESHLTDTNIKPLHIEISQWSKDQIDTFFLGDEVGCCLATNGYQFQAIVQRRMDDAMLFHVAKDKNTNKPIALIWLYLAETTDNQIVLMANFFEVKTKFGQDEYKRKALLNALLQFTNQYLVDNPGISGFYMNKLKYGWNIHDLDAYAVKPLSLRDKLGGPFIPGGIPEEVDLNDPEIHAKVNLITKQKYYLVSLNESEFRQFSPAILQDMMQENVVPISELLYKTIFELTKSKVIFEDLLKQVIQKHGIELEPFYNKPLHTNNKFLDTVNELYEKANLSHETGGNINSSIELPKHKHTFFKQSNGDKADKAPQDKKLGDSPKT